MRRIISLISFILVGIVATCSTPREAFASPETSVRPSGVVYYTCSVEGIDASRRPVVIVSNAFEVERSAYIAPTREQVINIFRWSMKMQNQGIYTASINKGGFYATCSSYNEKLVARQFAITQRTRAMNSGRRVIWVGQYKFNSETFLRWESTKERYKK